MHVFTVHKCHRLFSVAQIVSSVQTYTEHLQFVHRETPRLLNKSYLTDNPLLNAFEYNYNPSSAS